MRFRLFLSLAAVVALTAGFAPGAARGAPAGASSLNHVHSILVNPSNPKVLYLGGHYRLLKSTDGGLHWRSLLNQMMLSMALDPAYPSTMYGVSLQSGFLKSTDAGAHWSATRSRPTKGKVSGVAYEVTTKAVLAYGAGVYRSSDGGAHWSVLMRDQSISNISTGAAGTDYAASGNGLYVSRDGGRQWKAVASIGSQPIIQVASSGHTAYAVGPISLLKSSNDGHTWKELSKAPPAIEFIGVSPSNPDEVFAEVSGRGFSVTHNGGKSWQRANSGIRDSNFNASTIRVAPSTPNIAYTGAWGLHFYATRDGGRHWVKTASLAH